MPMMLLHERMEVCRTQRIKFGLRITVDLTHTKVQSHIKNPEKKFYIFHNLM